MDDTGVAEVHLARLKLGFSLLLRASLGFPPVLWGQWGHPGEKVEVMRRRRRGAGEVRSGSGHLWDKMALSLSWVNRRVPRALSGMHTSITASSLVSSVLCPQRNMTNGVLVPILNLLAYKWLQFECSKCWFYHGWLLHLALWSIP